MARGDLGAELPIEEVPLLQVISMLMHTASFHESFNSCYQVQRWKDIIILSLAKED